MQGEDNTLGDCNDTVIESIPESEISKSKLTSAGDDSQNQEEQFRPAEEVFPRQEILGEEALCGQFC